MRKNLIYEKKNDSVVVRSSLRTADDNRDVAVMYFNRNHFWEQLYFSCSVEQSLVIGSKPSLSGILCNRLVFRRCNS